MPQIHKALGRSNPAAATPSTLYTAPAATTTLVTEMAICATDDMGKVDSFSIFIVPSAGTAGKPNAICYSVPIAPGNPCFLNIAQTLNTGDFIVVQSSQGTVTFTASGLEIS